MKNHNAEICKKIAAGLLTAAVIVTGIFAVPARADAEGLAEDKIVYDNNYLMSDYWTQADKKAPVKEGYVFGGWYKDGDGADAITEAEAAEYNGTAYAKFVPAYVLSVKAQNESGVEENDNKAASIRLMSSVDGRNYQQVGITLLLNNKIDMNPEAATKVFDGIVVTEAENKKTVYANQIFGKVSRYVSVWRLNNILDTNDSKIIYVRPYWITPDGTKVEGLAKYVHVEDGYKNLVSVPVNLMTDKAVAAGALQVTCDDNRFEFYAAEKGVETGKLLTEMEFNATDSGKTVKIVGNAVEVGTAVKADGIYANVRFQLKDGQEYKGGTGDFLKFTVTGEDFCDWDEQVVRMDVWDVQY